MGRPRTPLEDRFWNKVRKTDNCWIWTGSKYRNGYGQISGFDSNERRVNLKAHRISYELHNGPISPGMFICHHCDNPSCVKPDHLFSGTAFDNVADQIFKGRRHDVSGEKNGQAKLKTRDIIEIRRLYGRNKIKGRYLRKGISQQNLAERFGVSQSMIGKIVRGVCWPCEK